MRFGDDLAASSREHIFRVAALAQGFTDPMSFHSCGCGVATKDDTLHVFGCGNENHAVAMRLAVESLAEETGIGVEFVG